MRSLCLADRAEWPARSGGSLRLEAVLTALAEIGDVDLFAMVSPGDGAAAGTPDIRGVTAYAVERSTIGSHVGVLARWAVGREPRRLVATRAEGLRDLLAQRARPPYDLIWYSAGPTFAWLGGVVPGRTIVDLDNLLDRVARGEREVRAVDRRAGRVDHTSSRTKVGARYTSLVQTTLDRIDERRWAKWQHRVATSVDAVVVCSDTDRARLCVDNAVVIPNGYEPQTPRPRRADPRTAHRFTMVARYTYAPNLDAAWFFADEVFPRIRAVRPDAEFRVVGAHDSRLDALAARPGITLTGEVPDAASELAATDVVVTPIRFGSGTRIKVVEAFAHRIPVVSTTVGCEGLGVVNGVHALVSDDSDAFADACTRLVDDDDLSTRLTESAHALFSERFQARDVHDAIVRLARDTAALPSGAATASW